MSGFTGEETPATVEKADAYQVADLEHAEPLTTLRVDPTARYVAAGAQDLDVQLWTLESGDRRTLKGHDSWVRSIDFSADGDLLYTACWGGVVKVWDLTQAAPQPVLSVQAHEGSARWVRLGPNGSRFATCGNDLLVKLWNAADGQLLQRFAGHERHVYGVDFHPDGEHLVSQDLMGVVKVWNIATGKAERTIDASVMTGYDNKFAADMGGSRDLHFRPDGTQWASAGITNVINSFAGTQDAIIVLFDWETGTVQRQLSVTEGFKGIAWGVRYHPGGMLIGAGASQKGTGELWFYEPDRDEPVRTLECKSAARGLDLVGDDRLAVAHADGHVRLYRMPARPAVEAAS